MSFFQNVIDAEFRGNLPIEDRQYAMTFNIGTNKNTSDYMVAWNSGPYDFSSSGSVVTFHYAWDAAYKNYSALSIDVVGASASATTVYEVIAALNANAIFSGMWVAQTFRDAGVTKIMIVAKYPRPNKYVRTWIANDGAEQVLGFNKKAPVAELPSYFARHTIANRFEFPDSVGMLIELDPGDPIDAAIITAAGLDPLDPKTDWELFRGRSQLFNFRKVTVDGSDRITQIIEYPAGALVGDFARQIDYVYTGANKNPSQITEIPHVLVSGDLVTPP